MLIQSGKGIMQGSLNLIKSKQQTSYQALAITGQLAAPFAE